jgi:hypothetical protein
MRSVEARMSVFTSQLPGNSGSVQELEVLLPQRVTAPLVGELSLCDYEFEDEDSKARFVLSMGLCS